MAAPMMDPNAAGPAPGDGFDGLFEELVEDSVEEHAHARVHGKETRTEVVKLEDSKLVGLLPKTLTDKQL